jgi:light-regulated signal transduction histidine kinase (bacteriophytochrome)
MNRNLLFEFTDLSYLLPPQSGLSTLVREEVSLSKMEEHLEQLMQHQHKLIHIIREIRPMFNMKENEITALNLDNVFERAICILQHVDCFENIDAVVHNESKDSFYGNELMLFSLFTSIIKISIEYRAKGTLKHCIRVVINDTKQGKQISLFDNGKGIKEEQQEETFCKIKQSVLDLGGSLQIFSDTDSGTVIICYLPSS